MPSYPIPVRELLEACQVRNLQLHYGKGGREEWYFSCPFHGQDENPSCSMNAETTEWNCFTCHKHGNAVKFVALHEQVSLIVASRWLREAYAGGFAEPWKGSLRAELDRRLTRSARARAQAEKQTNQVIPEGVLGRFYVDWQEQWQLYEQRWLDAEPWARYVFERRFRPDTLDAYQIGYDHDSERVTLPTRNEYGHLIGFKARAWQRGRKPKYLALGGERYDWQTFRSADVLYLLDSVQPGSWLYLVEGELNTLMCRQHGVASAVGLSGSFVSDRHAQLIRRVAKGVTLVFDSDEAGLDGQGRALELLEPFLPVRVCPLHAGDPASMPRHELIYLLGQATGSLHAALPQR